MNKNTKFIGVWIASANCLVALPALILTEDYGVMRVLTLISIVLFCLLLIRRLNNILFLCRTLFLGGIGYYPMMVKTLAGPDALFSLYEFNTQSFDIACATYLSTSLALFGNEIGLIMGSRHASKLIAGSAVTSSELWRTTFFASIPIIIGVSVSTIFTSGDTVFTAVYASVETESRLLGNTQNIGIICLLAMFVGLHKLEIRGGPSIFIGLAIFYLVFSMFLRGLRQDVVTTIFGLLVCYGLVHGKEYAVGWLNFIFGGALILIVEFMGVARGMIAIEGIGFLDIWAAFTSPTTTESNIVYHSGTVSPIATTFANIVYLIENSVMSWAYGWSYFEYIPRTPPEFIYPDRPMDYAWIFQKYDLVAGGGFFELAEAYMNFGLLGVLVVPGLLSYLMAISFFNALRKQDVLSYFLLFSFLGMFLRGTWYQTFAFYKSFLTAIILYAAFRAVHKVFVEYSR